MVWCPQGRLSLFSQFGLLFDLLFDLTILHICYNLVSDEATTSTNRIPEEPYTASSLYIYIYIYREREGERERAHQEMQT